MEKGYYNSLSNNVAVIKVVAIHNKNGKGLLLQKGVFVSNENLKVAIHNKNGKGLLQNERIAAEEAAIPSCRNPQ